ncbi:MAG: efflux RND transporter permease subunit [Muribaculaceae bacterium]|nr:efflux RND transporter permease subunit [Muribaculaceae bacterium]
MKLDTFINRPVLSTVISIFIVILGGIGLVSLPVLQYPDIAPPTIQVSATYTGANAQTVLNSVIAPLEEQINGALNMTYMSSTATNNGTASINVYFKQGYDPDMAAIDVQNRVSKAQGLLPSEVTKIGVQTAKRQSSMLMGITLSSPNDAYDQAFMENYMSINIIPEIKRVSGIGEAMVLGSDYSMRIWLKPDAMSQYNLIPSDVSQALAEQNIEAAPGQFGERGKQSFQYALKYKGRLATPEEFGDIIIRANETGETIYLKDIAEIQLGRLDYGFSNQINGHDGVTSLLFQSPGSNATEIINEVLQIIEQAKKELPTGLEIEVPINNNEFLDASISEVIKTLLEAFFLVFIVVYVFLQDLRSTIIPAIAIPVALVGTFFFMKMIGFSINLLTLSALVLAIAIVVDDAIVVVEAVHAKLDEGYKSARLASIDAMGEIGGAIISITLVMMLVFIPVSFMPGTSGVFYRQFGITMAISIALSALNALTLSPALCAVFLKPHIEDEDGKVKKTTFVTRFHMGFNAGYEVVLKKYTAIVNFFIKAKAVSFAIIIAAIGVLVWLMGTAPNALVPDEDTGMLFCVVSMPPATSQERTKEVLVKVDSLLSKIPAIASRTQVSGYSFIAGQGNTYGSIIIKMKNWEERSKEESVFKLLPQLYGMVAQNIKDGTIMFFAPPMVQGYSMSNGIELQLQDKTGGDISKFFGITQQFLGAINQRPEFQMAYSSFNPTYPQYLVDVDVAKAKRAGLSPQSILATMQGYYGGMYVSNFNRFGKLYRVMIQSGPDSRISPETLNDVKVRTSTGMAPITAFITLKKVYGPDIINRFNLFTAIPVTASVTPGYSNGDAIKAITEVAQQTLPQGYGYEFSGLTREESSESASATAVIFGLCLLFVYLLLSAQYESYILPLAVILSIPFGLMGSFIFADIFSISNNIYLKISLIMLIGLLAKNAILIVEFALDRRKTGMSIVGAAVSGASARLRPILMTSLALIVGLMPMMFASGVGANGNNALGTGAIGGMLIGMILQVVIVPCLFVVFQSIQEKFVPIKWKDTEPVAVEQEVQQYSHK